MAKPIFDILMSKWYNCRVKSLPIKGYLEVAVYVTEEVLVCRRIRGSTGSSIQEFPDGRCNLQTAEIIVTMA